MISARTRYVISLVGTLQRTLARLDKERDAPVKKWKKKGTGARFGTEPEYEERSEVPFWEAAVVCLQWQLELVSAYPPDDARFETFTRLGPWEAMVQLARRVTGKTNYGEAIIAQAATITGKVAPAPAAAPENVVAFPGARAAG